MLTIWTYTNRRQIEQHCEQVDFQTQTWILPDLRSKLEIQKRLFKRYGYTLDHFVLRASDLWKILLRKTKPGFEVISKDYSRLIAKNILKELQESNEVFGGLTETLWLEHLNRWNSVVFSEALQSELDQFLESHADLKKNIAKDFNLAKILGLYFEKSRRTTNAWIPALLQEELDVNMGSLWTRNLWIDLRGEMSLMEAELFQRLSQALDVNVFVPESDFEKEYHLVSQPYKYLVSKAQSHKLCGNGESPGQGNPTEPSRNAGTSIKQKVFQFSGPLAEVKAGVLAIRQWLDLGVPPSKIGVFAPEIEDYWPCLESYLRVEGVPVQKPLVSRMNTLPSLRSWLARLRVSMNSKDYFNLEKSCFQNWLDDSIRLEEFRSLLFGVYEERDLQRVLAVFENMKRTPQWPAKVSRDDFLSRSLAIWTENQNVGQLEGSLPDEVKLILEKFLREVGVSEEASPSDWLQYFEALMRQTEISLEPGDENGIVVSSLMSAWSADLQKILLLGISEEGLKSYSKVGLRPEDSKLLARDLGLVIESAERNFKEYELRWYLRNDQAEIEIYEPLTDWQGKLLNHTPFLLDREKLQKESATLDSSASSDLTRWDQIQNLGLEKCLTVDLNLEGSEITDKILVDLGLKAWPQGPEWWPKELSPSSVESYLRCPFVFFASKGLRLLDLADLEMDLDQRQKGQFFHAMAEALLDPSRGLTWTEEELHQLVDDLRHQHLMIFADDKTWPPRQKQFVRWSQNFLQFETAWRKTYPATKTLGREVSWRKAWLSPGVSQEEAITFRGKIDRVDEGPQGQRVILDYKSSVAGKTGPRSWLKNNEMQLLFYVWGVHSGDQPANEVSQIVGAFYYDLKKFDRSKGLQMHYELQLAEDRLLPELSRKNSGLNPEEMETLMEDFGKKVDLTLERMRAGHYYPDPADPKDCPRCRWNQICRGPHLL